MTLRSPATNRLHQSIVFETRRNPLPGLIDLVSRLSLQQTLATQKPRHLACTLRHPVYFLQIFSLTLDRKILACNLPALQEAVVYIGFMPLQNPDTIQILFFFSVLIVSHRFFRLTTVVKPRHPLFTSGFPSLIPPFLICSPRTSSNETLASSSYLLAVLSSSCTLALFLRPKFPLVQSFH